jgi:hypothetical protein
VGFPDGSYIELISIQPSTAGQTSPWWDRPIALDGGPCAWAVRHPDLAAETRRLLGLNVLVRGPVAFTRQRPDGEQVAWELLFLNQGDPGAVLPFLIQDTTPRELRVQPSPALAKGPFHGLSKVVLGVFSVHAWTELFRRIYDWPLPVTAENETFGARLAIFPDQPVILAQPLESGNWLGERLNRFGELPCAFLIGLEDLEAAGPGRPLSPVQSWAGLRLAWFETRSLGLSDFQLGVCAT